MERRGEKSPEHCQASYAACLPRKSPNPAGGELLLCVRRLCAQGTPRGGNRFSQPSDAQTYFAIAGDVTLFLQPPEVVFAFVVRLQMRVMEAVVLCAR